MQILRFAHDSGTDAHLHKKLWSNNEFIIPGMLLCGQDSVSICGKTVSRVDLADVLSRDLLDM